MGFARFAKRKNASFDSKSSTHFEPSDRKKGGKTFSLDPGEMQGKTFSTSGRAEFIVKNAKEIMIPTRHSHRSQTLTEHRTKKIVLFSLLDFHFTLMKIYFHSFVSLFHPTQ